MLFIGVYVSVFINLHNLSKVRKLNISMWLGLGIVWILMILITAYQLRLTILD